MKVEALAKSVVRGGTRRRARAARALERGPRRAPGAPRRRRLGHRRPDRLGLWRRRHRRRPRRFPRRHAARAHRRHLAAGDAERHRPAPRRQQGGARRSSTPSVSSDGARTREACPGSVFTAPTEVQAAFLRGLFGADGCVSRIEAGKASRYVGLGSRSEALLKDVQRLLNAFGVRGRDLPRSAPRTTTPFRYTRIDGTEVE